MQIKRIVIVRNSNQNIKDLTRHTNYLYNRYNSTVRYGNKRQRKSVILADVRRALYVFIGELKKIRGKYCWLLSLWRRARGQNLDKIKNRLPRDIFHYPTIYKDYSCIKARHWNTRLVSERIGISASVSHIATFRSRDLL